MRFSSRAPLAAAVTTLALAANVRGDTQPALPGPAPQSRAAGYDATAENAGCEGCHEEIAREWRGSLHHQAWDDPVFRTAYVIEPLPFCRGCHAPEADPARLPPEGARRLGVGCVTCHVRDGEIVGTRALAASGQRHAVRRDARLATTAACERCHQFDFPRPQRAPMQGTIDEHRASPHAGETCQSCHMPLVRGEGGRRHRSHGYRVIGDAALLRSAVTARAARAGDHAITVTLAAARVGHAFPTGDMFRRLEVRARVIDGAAAQPAVLGRRFVMMKGPDGPERRQIGDDRLPASGAAREHLLPFPESIAGRAVRWEVAYQRMDPGMSTLFGVDPAADEVIVAEGTIPADRRRR